MTTGGEYGDDLRLPGAAWVTFVRSTMAHARITSVDLDGARSMPGVVAVFKASDIDLPAVPPTPPVPPEFARPFVASDVVRYVGEVVAVVVTETRAQGVDAAEAVFVDYDPLPAVVDPESAEGNESVLFAEPGTNVCATMGEPLPEGFFDDCEVVVSERFVNQRVAPCPLEVRSAAAQWENGKLTTWVSNQAPHGAKAALAGIYGLEPEQLRVIAPDVGGGFGSKILLYVEDMMLPWLARAVGRPVRWTETRSESMASLGHGRAQIQRVTIGGDKDGRVKAYRLEVIQDSGAYPNFGAILPGFTMLMAVGTYDIAKVSFEDKSVVTNTMSTVAYRGAGRPEATAAIERSMDIFAYEVGMDPAEVRRINLIKKDAFPFTTVSGATYDIGDYERCLDLAIESSGYQELRAQQAEAHAHPDRSEPLTGVGISVYVEITNGAGPPGEYGAVEVLPDGRARVFTGTSPHGQGHATAWVMLAAEQLGIPMERIDFIANDTDLVPTGGGTMGSRSLQSGGLAIHEASAKLVDEARKLAAEALEASPDDVVLDKVDGVFHVAGTPSVSKSWGDLAASAPEGKLRIEHNSAPPGPTFPFGAHVAVVEVDSETGGVHLKRLVAVDDAGTILNPLLAEGQRHGGFAQGAAQALMEEFVYDADGNPVTANFGDYSIITATELPSYELVSMATPTPVNGIGAKGIGESGTIGSTPAVQSAVVDALRHLGVRHVDMPASPERIWRAISTARGNGAAAADRAAN